MSKEPLMAVAETKLFRQIKRLTGKAVSDFNLLEEGDRIAVAVSGGKDSYTLLHILEALRLRAPVNYELIAVNVDAGFSGYQQEVIAQHVDAHGFSSRMQATDCSGIIDQKLRPGTSYCAFCARLRRGVLYSLADELGCNKIALGHHLDDLLETLLLNQFYSGRLAAMSPKLKADNGRHTIIRPLAYVEEAVIADFSTEQSFPIVSCSCPVHRVSDQKRQRMKRLIAELAEENPDIRYSMRTALGNLQPRHLLDKSYYDC
jgi:tRNA 2-thiocytidine biosynthesis protein TtcA